MDSKAIARRLDALQRIASKNGPVKMTVTFADGSATVTDYEGMLAIVRDPVRRGDVVNITASRPDYAAAGIMAVLCHPAPDRRITDFE